MKKGLFYSSMIIFLAALGGQVYDYFWPTAVGTTRDVVIFVDWVGRLKQTGVLLLAIFMINFIVYKHESPSKPANKVDAWIFATSASIVGYWLLSRVVLVLIVLWRLGADPWTGA